MPTAYKGRFRMECRLERCSKNQIMTNVMPDCIVCENVKTEILDLDDKTVFSINFNAPQTEDAADEKPETVEEKGKKKR